MKRYLLDTDHVSLYDRGHPSLVRNLILHRSDDVCICVITIEEVLQGWQTKLRQTSVQTARAAIYDRMAHSAAQFSTWPILSFPVDAMRTFESLLKQRLNVRGDDLRIAAIALEAGAAVATRNVRDFSRVPNLNVVDWSVEGDITS